MAGMAGSDGGKMETTVLEQQLKNVKKKKRERERERESTRSERHEKLFTTKSESRNISYNF